MKTITIEYYAMLQEIAGKNKEEFKTSVNSVSELYQEIKLKYGFIFDHDQLRAAINDQFVDWKTKINNGDIVVFIPPVAGG